MKPEQWYKGAIMYELVKQLQFRYLSCAKAAMGEDGKPVKVFTRYYYGYTVDLLGKALEHLGVFEHPCRLYHDLAQWKKGKMLLFSWDNAEREEDKKKWDLVSPDAFACMDYALDLDAADTKSWKKAHRDAVKVRDFFEEKKFPFSVTWSGNKGFHFRIPASFFAGKRWKKPETWAQRFMENTEQMEAELKLKCVDYAIYDWQRVLKLPYSLDSSGFVVLPLTDKQLDEFDLFMVEPANVLRENTIRDRGMVMRNG